MLAVYKWQFSDRLVGTISSGSPKPSTLDSTTQKTLGFNHSRLIYTLIYYSSFHFLFHYPYITPI